MSSTTSLRDQRLRIYERQEAGSNGFSRPVYVYLYTLWGRLDIAEQHQSNPSQPLGHTEYVTRIAASFSYRAAIPENGMIKRGDEVYFIRGVVPQRQTFSKDVVLQRVSPENFAEFDTFEGDSVLDGLHLVYSSS